MPKKSKKSSAAGSSGAKQEEDPNKAAAYRELIEQDPNFHTGVSTFEFPNGDKYEGEFCAHVSGLVWRQGNGLLEPFSVSYLPLRLVLLYPPTGKYTTKDGHVYEGQWDGDKLLETDDVDITFSDGTKYFGRLLKSKYTGNAVYQMDNQSSFTCNFLDNKPSGEITLFDPNGRAWHGFAEKDDSLLIQEHAFYRDIGKDLGKGRCKLKPPRASKTSVKSVDTTKTISIAGSESGSVKYKHLRALEKEIFKKSKKTDSTLDFENSQWYRDYDTYRRSYLPVLAKVKAEGENALSPEEFDWYKQYEEFERNYTALFKNRKNAREKSLRAPPMDEWFRLIHSEEYKRKNKPTAVFYPKTTDSEECDSTCEC